VLGTTLFCAGTLGDGAGGDEFRATAAEYASKAQKARSQGQDDIAALYYQQASIKTNAAALADKGQWSEVDWTEYHANESLINAKLGAVKAETKMAKDNSLKSKTLKNKRVKNE
jgi:hypothetical protein